MGVRVEPISFTRKNIALVSVTSSPLTDPGSSGTGSQGLHVAGLAAALAALGHRVVVYTRRDHPHGPQLVHSPHGYEVVHVPAGPPLKLGADEVLAYAGDLVEVLELAWEARRPDVVHAHGWLSGIAAVLSARNSPVPVVQTYHSLGAPRPPDHRAAEADSTKRVAVERLIGHEVTLVVATSSAEARAVLGMGVDRSKLVVVPRGVDLDLFTPEPSGVDRYRPRRIVSVGRLLPRKGFDDLITALPWVPGTELVVAGGSRDLTNDPEARRLLACARSHGVADRVHLAGQVDRADMPALLRSADVVACVPWYEPFGIVPLEAMACGVPVVASSVGGLTDTVVHGVTGVLTPPRGPRALGRALRKVLADRSRGMAYGIAGRDRVEARYTWDEVATRTELVYQRVCATDGLAVAR
ncbi:glycosyltransferase [Lentzea sp.]|uniref:glycosyltransferase n=1 Tax=Lentzea sp. TaxID=56099 RepID=UPI002ED440A3